MRALVAACAFAAARAAAPLYAATAPAAPLRGFAFTSYSEGGYSSNASALAFTRAAAAGVRVAEIMFTWFVDNVTTATTVRAVPGRSPSAADVRAAVRSARAAGMDVVFKPHVDSLDGVWRANIGTNFTAEAQWAAFFASYGAFLDFALALAAADGLPVLGFNVGTELDGTHHREAEWRALIARARAALPAAALWLGANWNWARVPGYTLVNFWDALDFIGVDMYAPLAAADDPPLATAVAGWAPLVAQLASFSAAHGGKRVVFAEIGYASWRHAATDAPGCCAGPPDPVTQATLYASFFKAVWPQPWLAGVFWWAWPDTAPDGDACGTDFSIYAKPAAGVVAGAYGRPARAGGAAPVRVYSNGATDWADFSYGADVDLAAAAGAYPGHAASAAVAIRAGGGAFALHAPTPVTLGGLSRVSFDVRAPNASASFALAAFLCACVDCSKCAFHLPRAPLDDYAPPPAAPCSVPAAWDTDPAAARVTIPLAALMPAGAPWPATIERFQVGSDAAVNFGIDNIEFD
jgi:hypothetical protein